MSLWVCRGCTAAYSVGAPRCPQCGADDHMEEGQDMPKITVHGGASNAADDDPQEIEGGEEPSPGKSSRTSSGKQQRSPKTNEHADRSPARTTESPSPKARTASSTAATTGGARTGRTSAADKK